MKTNIEKNFQVDHPIDVVWVNLSDPSKVVTCVPGAELTEKIDERNYKGKVSIKFGPVNVKYNGAIEIIELDDVNHKMVLKGKGTDTRGKGGADMEMMGKLSESEEGGTDVAYSMEVRVSGMLAQFGSRLIGDVTGQLANQFIDAFKVKLGGKETKEDSAKEGVSLNAAAIAGNILKDKIGDLFGKKKESD